TTCGPSNSISSRSGWSIEQCSQVCTCRVVATADEHITCCRADGAYKGDGQGGSTDFDRQSVASGWVGCELQSSGPVTCVVNEQVKAHKLFDRAILRNCVTERRFPESSGFLKRLENVRGDVGEHVALLERVGSLELHKRTREELEDVGRSDIRTLSRSAAEI